MLQLRELEGPEDAAYQSVLELYHACFKEELRDPDFAFFGDGRLTYRTCVANFDDEFAGFVRWSALSEATFVVHLAVVETLRGKGLGRALIAQVHATHPSRPILLEVALEDDRLERWYRQLGARLLTRRYTQPALHSHTQPVRLAIWSIGPVPDPRSTIVAFYRDAWDLPAKHPTVTEALEGLA
ncbi:MAG TPA: GNAT family N-acetyltransferase [Fimbriimonadaceae bacterium]|nr:GNAT family N-acetyltransferase [Fimbriimonadaceae bacterium]